jgi:hypothetical protein
MLREEFPVLLDADAEGDAVGNCLGVFVDLVDALDADPRMLFRDVSIVCTWHRILIARILQFPLVFNDQHISPQQPVLKESHLLDPASLAAFRAGLFGALVEPPGASARSLACCLTSSKDDARNLSLTGGVLKLVIKLSLFIYNSFSYRRMGESSLGG